MVYEPIKKEPRAIVYKNKDKASLNVVEAWGYEIKRLGKDLLLISIHLIFW